MNNEWINRKILEGNIYNCSKENGVLFTKKDCLKVKEEVEDICWEFSQELKHYQEIKGD